MPKKAAKKQPVKTAKGRGKQKPVKRAKAKVARKPVQRLDAPPSTMAPPDMQDSRPTRSAPTPQVSSPPPGANVPETVSPPAPPSTTVGDRLAQVLSIQGKLAQGTQCTWIGKLTEDGLCPECGGPLMVTTDVPTMMLGVEAFELGAYSSVNPAPRPHPGYTAMVRWMIGTGDCWPDIDAAAEAYLTETGKNVDPRR